MKFAAFIVLAILGAANASLSDDIQEIKDLIPIQEIKAVTLEFAETDAEVQRVIAYLRSDKFISIVTSIRNTPEWQEFVNYLADAGVNIHSLIDLIYDLLLVNPHNTRSASVQRGFHDWANAVLNLIPFVEIRSVIQNKLQTSPDFQEFVQRLQSEEFQNVVNAVSTNSAWQELLQQGRDHGAPVDSWVDFLKNLLGWA